MNVGPKDDDSDDRGPHCGDQHGARGNILCVSNERMEILYGSVREKLQGSI